MFWIKNGLRIEVALNQVVAQPLESYGDTVAEVGAEDLEFYFPMNDDTENEVLTDVNGVVATWRNSPTVGEDVRFDYEGLPFDDSLGATALIGGNAHPTFGDTDTLSRIHQKSGSVSIVLWFQRDADQSGARTLFSTSRASTSQKGLVIRQTSGGEIGAFAPNGTTYTGPTVSADADNEIHMLVVTYDHVADELSIDYDNGTLTDTRDMSGLSAATGGTTYAPGIAGNPVDDSLRGRIAHVSVIGRVLSSADISTLWGAGPKRDSLIGAAEHKILFAGDSIVRGSPNSDAGGPRPTLYETLRQAGHSVEFVGSETGGPYRWPRFHEGHSGIEANELQSGNTNGGAGNLIDNWIPDETPDYVVLQIGTNDIASGQSATAVAAEVETLLDQMFALADQPTAVLLTGVPPIDDGNYPSAEVDQYNTELQSLANTYSSRVFYSSGAEGVGLADGVHPDEAGYETMGTRIATDIAPLFDIQLIDGDYVAASTTVNSASVNQMLNGGFRAANTTIYNASLSQSLNGGFRAANTVVQSGSIGQSLNGGFRAANTTIYNANFNQMLNGGFRAANTTVNSATITQTIDRNIYTASDDDTVRKIDADGNELWSFTGHTDKVNYTAVDPDGYVYTASHDNTVRKIDPSGNEVWSFTGHTGIVWNVAIDDSGNVYSASADNTVRKIDSSGNEVWSFNGDSSAEYAVEVDSNGYVYSGGQAGTVYKIDPNGNQVWSFTGHADFVTGVKVDPDGNVYSGSGDDTVRKIDSSGNQVWSFTGHTGFVYGIAVDDTGNVYSASQDETVRKIDSSGNQVWSFTGHTIDVKAVAVDPEGNVYTASEDNTCRKLDSDGNELWSFTGHTLDVEAVSVDPGTVGAFPEEWGIAPVVNVYSGAEDNTIRKIDADGNEVWSFTGFPTVVYAVKVDDNQTVYAGSGDQTVRKIDPSGNQVWSFTGHTNSVRAVAVDSDGNVYSGGNDDTVRKIDPSGNQVWSFTGHTDSVRGVAVDHNGNVYSGSWDDTVRKIDSNGTQVWSFTGHTNSVRAVAVDHNGNVYSCASQNVRKIDSDGNQVWSFTGHTNDVYDVAVDENGNVYSCGLDNTVRKIDSDGNQVWSFTGHANFVLSVTVDPDGYVYSTGYDDTVRKIDSDGNQVWSFTGHTDNGWVVAADPGTLSAFPEEWGILTTPDWVADNGWEWHVGDLSLSEGADILSWTDRHRSDNLVGRATEPTYTADYNSTGYAAAEITNGGSFEITAANLTGGKVGQPYTIISVWRDFNGGSYLSGTQGSSDRSEVFYSSAEVKFQVTNPFDFLESGQSFTTGVVTAIADGTSSAIHIDRTEGVTGDMGAGGDMDGFVVGANYSGHSGGGALHWFAVVNYSPSSAELEELWDYLNQEFGLAP